MTAPSPIPAQTSEHLLAPATSMGAVTLNVRDLAGTGAYYRDALALSVLQEGGGAVVLGRGTEPLVELVHTPDLPSPRAGQAGLFHTALLFADQGALASVVATAATHPRSRFVGSADHLVSRAFYFTDPEGNGIELYQDRPREQWSWQDGQVAMDTIALDPSAFLAEHLVEGADPGVQDGVVGHVHLKVGDLALASTFYLDVLGFEVTATMPGAVFFSTGGYHHHMAVNTWASGVAGPRAATLGLGRVAITLPGREHLEALAARLRAASVAVADDGATLRFEDPWRSAIEVSAAA